MGKVKFKPEAMQVRMVYTTDTPSYFSEYKDKVFVAIGPFDSFEDKLELQAALRELLINFNRAHPRKS